MACDYKSKRPSRGACSRRNRSSGRVHGGPEGGREAGRGPLAVVVIVEVGASSLRDAGRVARFTRTHARSTPYAVRTLTLAPYGREVKHEEAPSVLIGNPTRIGTPRPWVNFFFRTVIRFQTFLSALQTTE